MRAVFSPSTLEELWPLLEGEPGAALLAGGTDLLVKVRAGLASPRAYVALGRVEGLRTIREEAGAFFLGAGATHAELLEHRGVNAALPVLAAALRTLGSPPVRAAATLGGNLCTASPAGDCLPPLYALEAEVELASRGGRWRLPLDRFVLGPGRTALAPGEVLVGVRVPRPPRGALQHFEKVGQRKALAIAIASLAAVVERGPSGAVVRARLAWGSVGPTVVVCREGEQALEGAALGRASLERAAALARRTVAPLDDLRASARYRREVAGNLVLRLAAGARP